MRTNYSSSASSSLLMVYACCHVFVLLFRVTWVEVDGTKYSKGSVLVLESDLVPLFGVIQEVHCVSNQYYFVCKCFHTECFSAHFHAYRVTKIDGELRYCTISDLSDHYPLSVYTLNSNQMYVCMKYYIIEYNYLTY